MQFNEYTRQYSKFSKHVTDKYNPHENIKAWKEKGYDPHIYNKHYCFCNSASLKGGFLDADSHHVDHLLHDDPDTIKAIRLLALSEVLGKDWEQIGKAEYRMDMQYQDQETLGNLLSFMQYEMTWHAVGRPYYNVYPIVYEHMIKGIDLKNYTWQQLRPPYSPLLLKFPVGREPYGISCMMIRKHALDYKDTPLMCYSPRESNGRMKCGDFNFFRGDQEKHSVLWESLIEMSKDCQLEIEVQYAEKENPFSSGAITLMGTGKDTAITNSIENAHLRDIMLEDLFNKADGIITRQDIEKITHDFADRSPEIGGTMDFTGSYPDNGIWEKLQMVEGDEENNAQCVQERNAFHEFVLKTIVLVSEIHKTPGMIEDAILERDREEYVDANELRKKFLVDRASRRNGHTIGFDIGRTQQEQSDKSKGNPHYVQPFLRNQACGPRHSERKLIIVTGHMRGVAEIEQVPTGFEGDEQPKQPEYRYRPPISPALRAKVLARDKYTCQTCGRKPKDGVKLEAGHIISDKNGGKASLDNLIAMCEACNRGQSSRNIDKEALV